MPGLTAAEQAAAQHAAVQHVVVQEPRGRAAVFSLYAVFVFTGAATVLLGCILPTVSAEWRLGDERLGQLLLALFAGSACGALLVRRTLDRSIVSGLLLNAASALLLAFFPGAALILFFCYGLGLGWAMTGISLLVGSVFRERSGAALTLLNFFWSAGATVCPLATHALLRHATLEGLFIGVATIGGLAALLLGGTLPALDPAHRLAADVSSPDLATADVAAADLAAAPRPNEASRPHPPAPRPGLLIFFALFAMLYVGVEASLGGWVLSYVHRMPLSHDLFAAAAVSFFWLSLLAGRAIAPAVLLRVLERRLLVLSLSLAALGILFLLASHRAIAVIAGSCLAGLGLAPVFPLCVSIFLTLSGQSPRTRWLYAVSGAGGAVLPWLTGHVSASTGSLHAGLFVPLLAVLVMLGMLHFGWERRRGRSFALRDARSPRAKTATEAAEKAAPALRRHAASSSPSSFGGTPIG